MTSVTHTIYSATNIGLLRDQNEDCHSFCADLSQKPLKWLFSSVAKRVQPGSLGSIQIVADGMGGAQAGEIASNLVVESIKLWFSKLEKDVAPDDIQTFLKQSIQLSNKNVVSHQKKFHETKGMGTTLVISWIIKNQLHVSWVGDSRAYCYNKQTGLKQLSKDHSRVQYMVDSGEITREEAFYHPQNNIITQNIGDEKRPPEPGYLVVSLQHGDRILLCSDGLNSMLQDNEIQRILYRNKDTESCGAQLISAANDAGGRDNITIILCDVVSV
jgi:protein phosphatase